jgi:TonB family protein
MITRKHSNGMANFKLLMGLPAVAAMLVFLSVGGNNSTTAATSIVATPTTSQPFEIQKDSIYQKPEVMAQFPGGEKALLEFIFKNLKYPEEARKNGIQGRVIIRFCVTSKGAVDQVMILKKVHPGMDAEAVRVVKMLPEFVPAKDKGKPVSVWYVLPIEFKLN